MNAVARQQPAPIDARNWKLNRGGLVRSRTKSGAESKQRFATYQEARVEALKRYWSRGFREIWIDENDIVERSWRDLEPRGRPAFDDRRHVLSIEENDDE